MKIEDIEVHAGTPDFAYTPVRRLEVKVEAASNFASAPTVDEANAKLRELAVKVGANAIVEVAYRTGVSMTSWRSMTATGLAVLRESAEMPCPNCAETIKRAAKACRFCGAKVKPSVAVAGPTPQKTVDQPPLTATNNSTAPYWIATIVVLVMFLTIIIAAASSS